MEYLPYIWLILGLVLLFSEFLIPGFVIFFFGIAAIVMAGISWLIPGLNSNIPLQIIIWLFTSGLTLGVFRRFFRKTFKGKVIKGDDTDEFRGKIARAVESISENHPGRVTFQGTSWKAICYDEKIKKGDTVEILKKENLTLIVSKRG